MADRFDDDALAKPAIVRSPVRQRDLNSNIREHGFERGVVMTLDRALEEQAGIRQRLRDLTTMVSQCVSAVETMMQVGSVMTRKLDELKRVNDQFDNTPGGREQ